MFSEPFKPVVLRMVTIDGELTRLKMSGKCLQSDKPSGRLRISREINCTVLPPSQIFLVANDLPCGLNYKNAF